MEGHAVRGVDDTVAHIALQGHRDHAGGDVAVLGQPFCNPDNDSTAAFPEVLGSWSAAVERVHAPKLSLDHLREAVVVLHELGFGKDNNIGFPLLHTLCNTVEVAAEASDVVCNHV